MIYPIFSLRRFQGLLLGALGALLAAPAAPAYAAGWFTAWAFYEVSCIFGLALMPFICVFLPPQAYLPFTIGFLMLYERGR